MRNSRVCSLFNDRQPPIADVKLESLETVAAPVTQSLASVASRAWVMEKAVWSV